MSLRIPFSILVGVFVLSFLYSLSLAYIRGKGHVTLAYIQITLDTVAVSIIIYITGGFFSLIGSWGRCCSCRGRAQGRIRVRASGGSVLWSGSRLPT